jgi:arylsulfatase
MEKKKQSVTNESRRGFIKTVGAGAVSASLAGSGVVGSSAALAASSAPGVPSGKPAAGGYNILFIVTDQERFFRPGELPKDYRLPAHERLAKRGVVFENHRINSCVCTSSRSVLYTGRHIQQTKMFDNANFPWSNNLAADIKTLGHLMREAGYYTAYKGKWHLTKSFETENKLDAPEKFFTKEMEAYGFADYIGVGDIIAHTEGGYRHDGIITETAISWLRSKTDGLAQQGKPWFLAVNLVNPHDIMFYNTDQPGQKVQEVGNLAHLNHDPAHALYTKKWRTKLPASFGQRIDAPGRPAAHNEYNRGNNVMLGRIPDNEEWRWHKRHNYYLNCLRDVDRHVMALLDELDARGLASNTIVVLTSDHGELDGAHHLSGKGATSYREQNHVPLIVVHPAYASGKRCRAVTTHLDIVPTMISLTNASPETKAGILQSLPGKDISAVLAAPEKAGHAALRDGQLYCFNMFATIDGEFLEKASELVRQPGGAEKLKQGALRPNLTKRGAIRSVFDGRYQFTRYFSPKQHNRPTSMEELLKLNDLELFDHQNDPHELDNLAMDPQKNAQLILAMNEKLNKLIDAEVGEDAGQMLPGGVDGGWVASPAVNDL